MHHVPLAQVRHRLAVGQPLPFNVYRPDTTLLLARGQRLDTPQQVEALCERGSLVDLLELKPAARDPAAPVPADDAGDDPTTCPRGELPRLWQASMERVEQVLRQPRAAHFRTAMDDAAAPLEALVARDPDLAIFQVLRQEGGARVAYGVRHALRAGIVAQLVARRLGWSQDDLRRAFKAALTMNLSMLELQGVLAEQAAPPTPAQRQEIHSHPQRSRDLLCLAGIDDAEWLRAVVEHHEERDGSGYPSGTREPSELATLLHRADVYTAKLSSRATREAMAADRAAREIFMQDPDHPICAALVKEFGVYPPGCFVTLACGETGIVIARGATVMTPVVASLTDVYGRTMPEPARRDTREPTYAIVGVLSQRQVRAPLDLAHLVALTA